MLGASVKWEVGVLSWCCDVGQLWGHICVPTQQDTASTDGTSRAATGSLAVAGGGVQATIVQAGVQKGQADRQADQPLMSPPRGSLSIIIPQVGM